MIKKLNKNSITSKSHQEDIILSRFVAGYFLVSAINMSIKQLISFSPAISSLLSNIFMGLLFVFLLISIRHMLRRKGVQFVFTEALFLLLYLISFLMGNADSDHLIKTSFWTLGVCIPVAFYAYAINDKQVLLDVLHKAGYYQSVILCITLLSMNDRSEYSMSASYALVLPTLLFFYSFFSNHRRLDLLLGIICTVLILLFGARGPLLCIAFYILFKIIFDLQMSLKKFLLVFAGGGIISYIIIAWNSVAAWLITFIQATGIHSRTVYSILHGTITQTSGRDDLFLYYWNLIFEKPLTGWGLLGGWLGPGSGPHNMLLELLLAFGVILGGLLCIFAIYLLFRMFFVPHGPLRELTLIFAACNFSKYLIAGFFLDSPIFFVFIILSLTKSIEPRRLFQHL